ncbi:AAA family ATPase [Proteobacteria bacterium 005FR1]|nr:AAA family ATPase [Proteobacteria bacterium 005FR1]
MRNRLEVLLAGRSKDDLTELEKVLNERSDVRVSTKMFVNGHADPLQDVFPTPDAVILLVSRNWQAELESLQKRPAINRPALLVIGEEGNAELIKVAMRAGARDFLSPPLNEGDLENFLAQLLREKRTESSHKAARLTAVINAKGGSGASTLAANLSHILASSLDKRTVLVDMDLQFGSLPLYFNLSPRTGLIRALELVDSLDLLALEGYVCSYQDGLDIMAATPEDRVTVSEVPEDRVEMLLKLLGEAYDDIVVDVPRWISGATAAVLEHADKILITMEQSVTDLRDAQQLVAVLRRELNIAESQLTIVVNRFNKNHPVTIKDIGGALPGVRTITLPNDFKRVSQSIDIGTPLAEFAAGAPITRRLQELAKSLTESEGQLRTRASRWSLLNWARQ